MNFRISTLTLLLLTSVLAACTQEKAEAPPEKIVNTTVAPVTRKDLAVIESAVGAETAIVSAFGYDPTRVRNRTAYVRLPFPEPVAIRLKIGQTVTLNNFTNPDRTAKGIIREIRPALNTMTVSREVIVSVPTTSNWHPEGSVRGEVIMGVHKDTLVVPEQAVVLRPTGTVVYVVQDERVQERTIKSGILRNGQIQIVSGLTGNETVVVDGASLLSDGAKIKIREALL